MEHKGLDDDSVKSSVVCNIENEDQAYWLESTNEYHETIEFGQDISSIWCHVPQRYCQKKTINPEGLKLKLE